MAVVIDTNVPKTANGDATAQASPTCVRVCVAAISRIQHGEILVLDGNWRILNEYKGQLRASGQPGVGDAFLKWVLTNQANPQRCALVWLTAIDAPRLFAEFPDDPALVAFDPSDHKFVAVALSHPAHPSILNATDTDWWHFRNQLAAHGVTIDFLCPDAMARQ